MGAISKRKLAKNKGQILLHIVFVLLSLCYILPLMIVISASFSSEKSLYTGGGFSLFPKEFSLDAYKLVFDDPTQIIQSYITTATFSVVGTIMSVIVMAFLAYPLVRNNFKGKRFVNMFLLITMLFSGGMVPSYILNTTYLHLDDTIWIYILPGLVSAYNVFVLKAGYKGIPEELIEAAKVDGANEFYVCFRIMIPLAKATLATVAFLSLIGRWNDWVTTSIYIRSPKLYSLQYLLQKILQEVQYMKSLVDEGVLMNTDGMLPSESLRYALMLVAAGPMLIVFPFFQKYFVKGMTIGAVKG